MAYWYTTSAVKNDAPWSARRSSSRIRAHAHTRIEVLDAARGWLGNEEVEIYEQERLVEVIPGPKPAGTRSSVSVWPMLG